MKLHHRAHLVLTAQASADPEARPHHRAVSLSVANYLRLFLHLLFLPQAQCEGAPGPGPRGQVFRPWGGDLPRLETWDTANPSQPFLLMGAAESEGPQLSFGAFP